ncbi:MAG: mechanosensitive ion channel [Dehalococcoidia bacterium]
MDALWPGQIDTTVDRLAVAALAIVGLVIVSRVLMGLATFRIEQASLRYSVRKTISFAAYAGAVAIIAIIWRPSLGGFGVALGVAGAGIAFALQEVITSVAGWFAISFAGFYKPGDRVQLGGIKGDVIDVGLLRTTVMEIGEWVSADLYNGRVVRIANSFVFKEPVFNYSGDIPFLWDEVMFPIRYGSDWKLARDTLTAIGNEVVDPYRERAMAAWQSAVRRYQLENVTLEPMVAMLPTDNWIEMRLRYIVDYRVRRKTQDMIATRMLEAIDGSEGRIQFASQTIQVVAGSQISVDRPT